MKELVPSSAKWRALSKSVVCLLIPKEIYKNHREKLNFIFYLNKKKKMGIDCVSAG